MVSSRPVSRAIVLVSSTLALMLAVLVGGPRSVSADTKSDAVAVVQSYYSAIDAFAYKEAYANFGSAWQKGQSLSNFTNGFTDTAFVELDVKGTSTDTSGNTIVKVTLTSWHNDGKIVGYAGNYTIGMESGNLRILTAFIVQAAVPKTTLPLCANADLDFSFGPWDAGAGNRFSSLVAENTSKDTCVLGGAPRLIVTDTTNHTVTKSTGEPGAAPTAIILDHGDTAVAPVRLANWCQVGNNDTFKVQAEVAADDTVGPVDAGAGLSIPPCLGEGQPALLTTQGFQLPPQ